MLPTIKDVINACIERFDTPPQTNTPSTFLDAFNIWNTKNTKNTKNN